MERLLTLVLAAIAFVACTQNEVEELTANRAEAPETLTVGFEGGDTRVELNEALKSVWTEGDEVSVFYRSYENTRWAFQGATGDRSGELILVSGEVGEQTMDNIVVVYPYSETYVIDITGGYVEASLPAVQSYKEGSYGAEGNIMVAESDYRQFILKSVVGWLRVELTGEGEVVESITLRGNAGEQVAGDILVNAADASCILASEGAAAEDNSEVAGNLMLEESILTEITLDGGEGVELGSEAKSFYIGLLPQTFEKGMTIEINCAGYKPMTLSTESSITIERNHIKPMAAVEHDAELDVEIDPTQIPDNEIWYITNNGKLYDHLPASISNANIVSHTYDKKGIIQFDAPLNLIKRKAFCTYDGSQNYLIKIALPNCVETIEAYAFQCNQISTFHTPNSLKYVGKNFIENSADIDISFTGKYATKDGRCIIIDDILYIGKDIKGEYVIPNGVKTISDGAFANNIKMEQIVFPDGLTDIRYGAFMGCTNLSGDIYIPNSVELIEERVFSGCGHITSFWGNTLFTDESQLFLYAYNVVGQKTITCFASGAAVRSIIIPEGVEMIGYGCFMSCDFIESITFPNSLRLIGEDAFDGCTGLSSFYGYHISDDNKCLILDYPNLGWAQYYSGVLMAFAGQGVNAYKTPNNVRAIAPLVFKNHPSLQKIVINDEVTYIGMYAFNDNPNLQEIVLPSSLLEMSYDPFKGCNGLNAIYCRSMIPPKLDYIYQTDFPNLTIYVPEQSLQAYLDSPDWAPYRGYIQGYEYTDLPENDTYISSDYSKDGEVTTLQTATKGKGIDIVLMGDAYSDRQIADGTYKTDMEYIYNNLFTEEPYKSFKDHFNVYCVNVVSVTEGYEHGGTALGGYFGNGTLVGGNDNAVFDYALNAISEEEMDEALLIVAMNSDNYAGTCYMYYPDNSAGYGNGVSVSYFPKGGDATTFAQLLHHEACGHGFAKLADEYAYEDMGAAPSDYVSEIQSQQANWGWWKNVDFTSDLSAIRWKHFINDTRYANDGLGAYEGGLTYWTGVWRPTENSIMRYNTGGFNAPSREAIYYRIHKLAYGDSWEYDFEKFVEWDARNMATAATHAMVYKPANYKPTHPPVIVNKSWKDAK